MTPAPSPLLQQQLEATLQLVLAFLPTMTTNDLLLASIRLTDASTVVRQMIVDREAASTREL